MKKKAKNNGTKRQGTKKKEVRTKAKSRTTRERPVEVSEAYLEEVEESSISSDEIQGRGDTGIPEELLTVYGTPVSIPSKTIDAFKAKFSEKQLEVLSVPLKNYNILVGSTGSGKSYVANLRWYKLLCDLERGDIALMTGNTQESLFKNVISEIMNIDDGAHLTYTKHPSQIVTDKGAIAFCVGVNNDNAEKRLRGGSVRLWYADEVTLHPETAFNMCLGRCRGLVGKELKNMPALMTCNKDIPTHYIKLRFVDNRENLDMNYWEFNFTDNPTITEDYINELKNIYSGSDYDRLVLNLWTGDKSSLIVPEFTEKESECVQAISRPDHYRLYSSLDLGFDDNSAYLIGYYHFGLAKYIIDMEWLGNNMNSQQIANEIKKVEGTQQIYKRVSDIDKIVIADLNRLHGLQFYPAKKADSEAGINFIRTMISTGKLLIHPNCSQLISQLRSGTWNKTRTSYNHDDKHGHFDLIDSLKYILREIDPSHNPLPKYNIKGKLEDYHIPPDYRKKQARGWEKF